MLAAGSLAGSAYASESQHQGPRHHRHKGPDPYSAGVTSYYSGSPGTVPDLSANYSSTAYQVPAPYNYNYSGIVLNGASDGMVGWNIPTYCDYGHSPADNTPFVEDAFYYAQVYVSGGNLSNGNFSITNFPDGPPFAMVIQTSEGFYHVSSGQAPSGLARQLEVGTAPAGIIGTGSPYCTILQGPANGFYSGNPNYGFNPPVPYTSGGPYATVNKCAFIYFGTETGVSLFETYSYQQGAQGTGGFLLQSNASPGNNVSFDTGASTNPVNFGTPELRFNFED